MLSRALPALTFAITVFTVIANLNHARAAPPPADVPPTNQAEAGPRHVILLIGDGMGEHQITIARNYLKGSQGRLTMDTLPLRATVQVLATEDKANGKSIYVSDSANTATAIASGIVTSRGRIGTAPGSGESVLSIVELAGQAGYRTGLVTTASVTDATPAAFAAHINLRRCENPSQMSKVVYRNIYLGECIRHLKANGGGGSIAEQLVDSDLDVILGGGSKHFLPKAEASDSSVIDIARARGFTVLDDPQQLAEAVPPARLLGLFWPSTLPVRFKSAGDRSAEQPEPSLLNQVNDYLGGVTLPTPMTCENNSAAKDVPSLKAMTDAALAHLSRDNERGFFLMIESASIDKQAHERMPCGSIGEVEQLEEALESSLAFASEHPNTLVLVTADHSHAAQLVPEVSLFDAYPVPVYTPGRLARLITPEDSIMSINYATNNFVWEEHTGASVPLYANAEGRGRVPAFIQQPDLFDIMRDYLLLAP